MIQVGGGNDEGANTRTEDGTNLELIPADVLVFGD